MDISFNLSVASRYKSKSQIARVLTEDWVSRNVYCPSCGCNSLNEFPNNVPVADFSCSGCRSEYELKSKKDNFGSKIVDGAYKTIIGRINSNNNPNFFFLDYSYIDAVVNNFFVIPKHYFVEDVIEKRKPLKSKARRAGWVGCNILFNNIPELGKIYLVKKRLIISKKKVLNSWSKTNFLTDKKIEARGWILEIMKIVDEIPKKNFTLSDVYKYEEILQEKYPKNNFIKDKIRQQLQILRDNGLIQFKGRGKYMKL